MPISQNYETAILQLSFEKLFGLKQTKSIKKFKISSIKVVFKHVVILLIKYKKRHVQVQGLGNESIYEVGIISKLSKFCKIRERL